LLINYSTDEFIDLKGVITGTYEACTRHAWCRLEDEQSDKKGQRS